MDNEISVSRRNILGLAAASIALIGARGVQAAACPSNPPPDGKFVNLKDFYPGSGDHSTAFQNAINSLNSFGGGALYLPSGCYTISTQINFKSNIKVFGNGESSIINFNSGGSFKLNYSVNNVISDLKFVATGAEKIFSSGSEWGCANIEISNNHFIDCGIRLGTASHATFGKHAIIQNNRMEGKMSRVVLSNWSIAKITANTITAQDLSGANNNVSGIRCENSCTDVIITNNNTYGCTQNGIQIYHGNNIVVSNNNCSDNLQSGIGLNTESASMFPSNIVVTNNVCRGNKYDGIDINYQANVTISHLIVSGNLCSNNRACGIWIYRAKGATISGNICQVNGTAGIGLNSAQFCNVSSNFTYANFYYYQFPDTDKSTVIAPAQRHGISLDGCRDCTIVGNISSNDGSGVTQEYGVFSASNCLRILCNGNNAFNNKIGGLQIGGTSNIVSNNLS